MVGVRNGEFQFPRPTHGPDSLGNRPHFSAGEALLSLSNQQLDDIPFGGTWGHLLPDIPPGLNYSFYTSKLGHPNPVFAWRSKFSDFLYKADPERPVRTIKAQGGKYTGPLHWSNRHFTSDELKLLQSFPEDFVLIGTEAVKRAVIGNSVPPLLSRVLAESVMVQIFNSDNNQGLTWLGEDEKLSFRSLKRQRTEYYAQKALESHSESTVFAAELRDEFRFKLDGLVNIVENDESDWKVEIKKGSSPSSSYDVLQLHIRNYPCEDGGLSSCRTFPGPYWANYIKRFSEGEASILDAKYDAKGKLSKLWAQSRLKGKITLLPNVSWDVPYSSVEVYCYSEHQESLTSCFKAAELVIRERNRIDDLVQLNGFYQQPNQSVTIDYLHISGNMDESWGVASIFSKTDLIGKIVPIEEWCDLLSKEPGEVFEMFRNIRLQGFDIRDNHTNQQIEPGKVLVTYAFPTLTTSKVQWEKRLGGMLQEEIAMEIG